MGVEGGVRVLLTFQIEVDANLNHNWRLNPKRLGTSKVQTWIEWQKLQIRFSFTLKGEKERGRDRGRGRGRCRCREKESRFSARTSVLHIHDLIDSRSLLLQSALHLQLPLPPSLFTLFSLPSAFPIWAMRSYRLCLGSVVSFLTMNWCDYAGLSCTLGWVQPPPRLPLRDLPRGLANLFNSNERVTSARGLGCNHCDLRPSRFVS